LIYVYCTYIITQSRYAYEVAVLCGVWDFVQNLCCWETRKFKNRESGTWTRRRLLVSWVWGAGCRELGARGRGLGLGFGVWGWEHREEGEC
jgi:hypothetical protein